MEQPTENKNFIRELQAGSDAVEAFNLSLAPFGIYRLDFEVECQSPGFWYADFFNAAGIRNYADNYSGVYASREDYKPQSALFMARAEAVKGTVGFKGIYSNLNLKNIKISEISKSEAVEWLEKQYLQLPPIKPVPDPSRWELLPKTRKTLAGKNGLLRIAALGDSISNDMLNGLGHLLIEKEYPGLSIQLIHANGPEKSTDNYQDDEVLQRLVTRHQPDLFTVAGMSHKPESIRNVIRKVRSACDNVETVYFDIRVDGDPEQEARLSEFDEISKMGETDGFAVWDMTTQYENCLKESPHLPDWFRRDSHHSNDRGKQILGRLFAAYFSGAPAEF